MIERIHLSILREMDRRGSLTGAAAALHLTQPALSHAVRKLEGQLGTALWHKAGRRVRLTPAGQYLLGAANRLLPQLERVDEVLRDYAAGNKAQLRIGMECHPCYQWLLQVVAPYLQQWPAVDLDVKQQFQFGGMAALFNHEIDMLVTPDPLEKKGVHFEPVFDYEQVLVVGQSHRLAGQAFARPRDLLDEVLLAYPVEPSRLDIYTAFLLPAQCSPRKHQVVEATEIMLQLVASGRGVAALPRWLVEQFSERLPICPVRLGEKGIAKRIHLGVREEDTTVRHIAGFVALARG